MSHPSVTRLAPPAFGARPAMTAEWVAQATPDEVLACLGGSAEGLSGAEATARLKSHGPNAVRSHEVSALAVLGRQLRSALLLLLAGTAVLSYFFGDSTRVAHPAGGAGHTAPVASSTGSNGGRRGSVARARAARYFRSVPRWGHPRLEAIVKRTFGRSVRSVAV